MTKIINFKIQKDCNFLLGMREIRKAFIVSNTGVRP